jgi:DNA-binding transcriptional LysR family regulator
MDRLESFAIFVKAVDLGSFSAAAQSLNLSPQLVGRQVQRLEDRLGVQLLQRTTRRQVLTDFGREFYDRARQILAEVEAAETLAEQTRAAPRGKLRINAPVSFGIAALTPRLPAYLAAYPQVTVELSLTNRRVDPYEEGFDAVFRVGHLADSALRAVPLAAYRLTACASPAYLERHPPIQHPLDLMAQDCLCFTHTELRDTWTFQKGDLRQEVPVQGRFAVDHGEALRLAALAGLGVILQPDELVRPEIAAGRLVQILPDWQVPTRPLHLLYLPDRRLTPKLRSFLDFAKAAFPAG